jgi:hypothetical protein
VEDLWNYKAVGMHHTVKARLRGISVALRPAQMLSSMKHDVVVGAIASQNQGHADSLIEARKRSKGARWPRSRDQTRLW